MHYNWTSLCLIVEVHEIHRSIPKKLECSNRGLEKVFVLLEYLNRTSIYNINVIQQKRCDNIKF